MKKKSQSKEKFNSRIRNKKKNTKHIDEFKRNIKDS